MKIRWICLWSLLIGLVFPWVAYNLGYFIASMMAINNENIIFTCGALTLIMMTLVFGIMIIVRCIKERK